MAHMKHLTTLAILVVAMTGCQMMSRDTGSAHPSSHALFTPDKIEWKPAPPSLRPGAQVAILEGDPARKGFFTMRGRFPANYRIAPHWHPNYERVTIISGTLYLGSGDTVDEKNATPLTAGSYSTMPPGMRHFAFTKEPTEIQVTTMGPWAINYVNPADDPRNSK